HPVNEDLRITLIRCGPTQERHLALLLSRPQPDGFTTLSTSSTRTRTCAFGVCLAEPPRANHQRPFAAPSSVSRRANAPPEESLTAAWAVPDLWVSRPI